MKIRIGKITIPDAEVKRFIDLQSGLPLSMIKVSYEGEGYEELGRAFNEGTLLPFECIVLKTEVLVHGSTHDSNRKKHEYVLLERAADVSSGYKLIHTSAGYERAIIVPDNTKEIPDMQRVRDLPFIRLILEKDIPKDLLES